MTPNGDVCVASRAKLTQDSRPSQDRARHPWRMLWAEWSVQLLPTKPEECAPEHVLNVSFGRIPEPLARLEKFASSFFERKPGVLIVRGFSTIKKIVDVGPAQFALAAAPIFQQ